jgi:hypothetical protein
MPPKIDVQVWTAWRVAGAGRRARLLAEEAVRWQAAVASLQVCVCAHGGATGEVAGQLLACCGTLLHCSWHVSASARLGCCSPSGMLSPTLPTPHSPCSIAL